MYFKCTHRNHFNSSFLFLEIINLFKFFNHLKIFPINCYLEGRGPACHTSHPLWEPPKGGIAVGNPVAPPHCWVRSARSLVPEAEPGQQDWSSKYTPTALFTSSPAFHWPTSRKLFRISLHPIFLPKRGPVSTRTEPQPRPQPQLVELAGRWSHGQSPTNPPLQSPCAPGLGAKGRGGLRTNAQWKWAVLC